MPLLSPRYCVAGELCVVEGRLARSVCLIETEIARHHLTPCAPRAAWSRGSRSSNAASKPAVFFDALLDSPRGVAFQPPGSVNSALYERYRCADRALVPALGAPY